MVFEEKEEEKAMERNEEGDMVSNDGTKHSVVEVVPRC